MAEKITAETLSHIANPVLRDYARTYVDIEEGFREAVMQFGVSFETKEEAASAKALLAEGRATCAECGVRSLNNEKSLVAGWQSSACEACRLGVDTETFVLTLACPRRCFFCFNPNQEDFDGRVPAPRDVVSQLEARSDAGAHLRHVALTGGEPLLFPDETMMFFQRAQELFPGAHTRLYTSGWGLDAALLERLRDAGLTEIRFSIKTDDAPELLEEVLSAIRLACSFISDVMAEMPVMPDEVPLMKELLVRLDEFGVRGINLLELGFPLFNGEEFARRGFKLKRESYQVLYDYVYAAGLPVAGSEQACLDLLAFVAEQRLLLGAHFCSMENKHTGQVFQQNRAYAAAFPGYVMSPRDHFLKSAKVFGADREPVRKALSRAGLFFVDNDDFDFTAFEPAGIEVLRDALPATEVAMSIAICEPRDGEATLRELALALVAPASYDGERDL